MIRQKIMAHEEPKPVTYFSGPKTYIQMNEVEKAEYQEKMLLELFRAKCLFSIGDQVQLESSKTPMVITGFVEDPAEVITYKGNMCVVTAMSPQWSQPAKSLRYSIEEFNLDSLVKGTPENEC